MSENWKNTLGLAIRKSAQEPLFAISGGIVGHSPMVRSQGN